jgi:integrase
MPPPRTGNVEPLRRADGSTYYRARVRLADGTRERVDVPESYSVPAGGLTGRERAELYAAAAQEREDEGGDLLAKKRARLAAAERASDPRNGETCSAYRKRLDDYRAELGRRGLRFDRSTWSVWIAPLLGPLPIAKVTRDDVEGVRDMLDAKIVLHRRTEGKEGIGSKRALNVWTAVTSTFKAACNSKRRDLRVRDDNPCAGVLPPEKGESRRRTFVYPNEMSALLACKDVPIEARELYAVASYLYLRPGELRALLVADVDLDAGVVHVTKAYDEEAKDTKAPKTRNGIRDVPIVDTLAPLLQRLVKGREGSAPLVDFMASRSSWERARSFRRNLEKAKVTRPRLTADNAGEEGVDFRSLRDTGITWLALAGVDVPKIMRRAGHDSPSTSMGYVKIAEDINGEIGAPFPPLPAELVGDPPKGPKGGGNVRAKVRAKLPIRSVLPHKHQRKPVAPEGLEPCRKVRRIVARGSRICLPGKRISAGRCREPRRNSGHRGTSQAGTGHRRGA